MGCIKGKIFNFNENNENHKVYPSVCAINHCYQRVPVKCETKRETKYTETKPNETKFTETKRNGIIQNEIQPILAKQFLGERQDKN